MVGESHVFLNLIEASKSYDGYRIHLAVDDTRLQCAIEFAPGKADGFAAQAADK